MNIKSRVEKLEKSVPNDPALDVARMKPSEIVRLADEILQQGYEPNDNERARLDALRKITG